MIGGQSEQQNMSDILKDVLKKASGGVALTLSDV
jgi:hypothetical protein